MKLKFIELRDPISLRMRGDRSQSLEATAGQELELDLELRVVWVTSSGAGGAPTSGIPLEMVRRFEPLIQEPPAETPAKAEAQKRKRGKAS